MPNISIGDGKELVRLRREVFTTIRIQNPNFQQSEAFHKLVSDALSSSARAGVKESELTRMTLAIAQKLITTQAQAAA